MEESVVKMTVAEMQEFEAFKQEKEEKERQKRIQESRKTYKELVDETVEGIFPHLVEVSKNLQFEKKNVYSSFKQAIEIKGEIYDVHEDQRSHTFTNSAGDRRITLGQYVVDGYDDTVNEGISKVKEFISSLARDDESSMLVNGILRLLSKDKDGNLKASRVIQLSKMANESGNEKFIDGVRIIQESYRPSASKKYIRAEYKNEKGEWKNIPLGMTEAE
jgi:hypothetical protein